MIALTDRPATFSTDFAWTKIHGDVYIRASDVALHLMRQAAEAHKMGQTELARVSELLAGQMTSLHE